MISRKPNVLIVDDEQVVCDVLHDELGERGYRCTAVLSGAEALIKLAAQHFEVALLDIKLPGMSGMDVLREICLNHGSTATIMITAVRDIDTVVEAMKLGASDYIVKPFNLEQVVNSIRAAAGTEPATDKSPTRIDAIARGVEARLDSFLGYSKIVTQESIDIARQLGIAEEEIQRWAAMRAGRDARRHAAIESSLNKLKRSPFAQRMMGLAIPYQLVPKPDELQN